VAAGLVAEAGQWPWSSYRAHAGLAPAPDWLDTDGLHGQRLGHTPAGAQDREEAAAAVGVAGEPADQWVGAVANCAQARSKFVNAFITIAVYAGYTSAEGRLNAESAIDGRWARAHAGALARGACRPRVGPFQFVARAKSLCRIGFVAPQ